MRVREATVSKTLSRGNELRDKESWGEGPGVGATTAIRGSLRGRWQSAKGGAEETRGCLATAVPAGGGSSVVRAGRTGQQQGGDGGPRRARWPPRVTWQPLLCAKKAWAFFLAGSLWLLGGAG